jgi:hypothetical protein
MRVYLSLPSYDQRYWGNTLMSVLCAGNIPDRKLVLAGNNGQQKHELGPDPISGSVLPRVFNEALGRAVCRKHDVLVMMHADVAGEPGWLTKMLTVLDMTGADVLSAVVSLKDDRRLTSTGIHTAEQQFRNLSLDECWGQCQQTFGIDDPYLQQQGATALLINTGLLCMRLDRPWLKHWHGFQIRSRIVWGDTQTHIDTVGEDWDMSEQLAALGCKIMATTCVQTHHWGAQVYASAPPTPSCGEWVLPGSAAD